MIRARALRAREKLLSKLPVTGELLRGSLLERTIEGICELNHELLRPDAAASKSRRKQHD
jgi:hypothetical protein